MKINLTHDEMQIIKSALNSTVFVDNEHETIKDILWVKFANAISEDLKPKKP